MGWRCVRESSILINYYYILANTFRAPKQWDLNTGHQVRKYTSTGAQVAVVAVRPLVPVLPPPSESQAGTNSQEDDTKSDASYDPLFDEPEEEDHAALPPAKPNVQATSTAPLARPAATYPRGPPVLDSVSYGTFSPDVLMTASIDGSIVLWDQRVNTPGKGVGRLEMSNKTPPWCVSVSVQLNYLFSGTLSSSYVPQGLRNWFVGMLVGRRGSNLRWAT